MTLPSEANGRTWIKLIRESLASGRSFLFVAKNGKKPVGFAYGTVFWDFQFEVSQSIGLINDVYVLPEFRGKGIGQKLVIECLKKLKKEGIDLVRLTVLKHNESAVRLYEKLGFETYRYGMMQSLRH